MYWLPYGIYVRYRYLYTSSYTSLHQRFPEFSFNLIGNSPLPFNLPSNSFLLKYHLIFIVLWTNRDFLYYTWNTRFMGTTLCYSIVFKYSCHATVHDVAHLALPDIFGFTKRIYAKYMFQILKMRARTIFFILLLQSKSFNV